jgi:hypothetical protein
VRVLVKSGADDGTLLYDSDKQTDISSLGYELPITLESYTRYFWQVKVGGITGKAPQVVRAPAFGNLRRFSGTSPMEHLYTSPSAIQYN